MDYRTQLLTLANAYAASTGKSVSRLATIVAGSGIFFDRIEAGASCTVDTYLRAKQWFRDNWPVDLAWPDGVDRPGIMPEIQAAE